MIKVRPDIRSIFIDEVVSMGEIKAAILKKTRRKSLPKDADQWPIIITDRESGSSVQSGLPFDHSSEGSDIGFRRKAV